jgi:DNA-binding transcriptional regulator YdaS (Cro superfamily)
MKLKLWVEVERGRATQLARHLGVSQPTVSDWSSGKKQVPLDHCPLIQSFTEGAVTCEELRPDKAEYFALIRAQASDVAAHPACCARAEPPPAGVLPYTGPDRRDPNRPSAYAGTEYDRRRAAASAAGEN